MSEQKKTEFYAKHYGMGKRRLGEVLDRWQSELEGQEVVEQPTKKPAPGQPDSARAKSYTFKSAHPLDIDFSDIAAGLSRKNPLALVNGHVTTAVQFSGEDTPGGDGGTPYTVDVDVETEETYVVVHPYLYEKSGVAGLDMPSDGFYKTFEGPTAQQPYRKLADGARVYLVAGVADFAAWVKWAKEVRGASWRDSTARRGTFHVSFPTV